MKHSLNFTLESVAKNYVQYLLERGLKPEIIKKEGNIKVTYETKAEKSLEKVKEEIDCATNLNKTIGSQQDKEKNYATVKEMSEALEKIKGMTISAMSEMQSMYEYAMREYRYEIEYVMREVQYLYKMISEHEKDHLPPIKGAEKMRSALNILGIEDDYEIQKPIIYAQRGEIFLKN